MRLVSDEIKNMLDSCAIFLLNNINDKLNIIASSSDDIPLNIGQIIKEIAKEFGAKGGGKKNSAQAGGFLVNETDKIINAIKSKIDCSM